MRIHTLALLAALLLPAPLLADSYTYTYSGQAFTQFANQGEAQVYTSSDSISGYFTLSAPLADNMPFEPINPTSFSFSDGVDTITNTSANLYGPGTYFEVETNSTGAITAWDIEVDTYVIGETSQDLPSYTSNEISTDSPGSYARDFVESAYSYDYQCGQNICGTGYSSSAYNSSGDSSTAGTWGAATPEPPSLMLLATGLLGIAGLLRRRVVHI